MSVHPPLFDAEGLRDVDKQKREWEQNELDPFLNRQPEGHLRYLSEGGRPLNRIYTPLDVAGTSFEDIGFPGAWPFTRGPYPTMYRGRTWTMRQIAGYGTAADTNERFKFLTDQGQTGLSVDFDMPTLMGYDSDDPLSFGEVGRAGVAIDVLDDMEALFEGIDITKVSVSMTINPSAFILFAMYIALANRRGHDLDQLSGTLQNDILKEYQAQREWIYPVRPSMRLVRDVIDYATKHMARYNPINISGYHISEAGATATQEAAFTMANTIAYVEEVLKAGLDVDDFAPRLSFFFVSQADFFEEIAKFRAVRRAYAKIMRERFGAKKAESMRLRFHTQTAAATLTKPQPENNIVRTALQALAAVLAGTQSLHTNGLDEAFAIPSEKAMKIALRTQQIIAEETNVANVVDPLGGSWYLEALTNEMEQDILKIIDKVDGMGGTLAATEKGWFQQEIADSAYAFALRKAIGERTVVGVNKYADPDELVEIPIHKVHPEAEQRQVDHLRRVKSERDNGLVNKLLENLKIEAREDSANLIPAVIALVEARASMGEIVKALKEVFGSYTETPVF